jgi:deoxyribodipyrimidine photo-lyase
VADNASCAVFEVESDLVVPVAIASPKREYAARTIRPKIHRLLADYLVSLPEGRPPQSSLGIREKGENITRVDDLMKKLRVDAEPGPVTQFFTGGPGEARRRLSHFLDESLACYEERRSEPGDSVSSQLSPYLHFGQISSLEVALRIGARHFADGLARGRGRVKNQPGTGGTRTSADHKTSARDAFLEELLVRRELAYNYVWHVDDYDSYEALPDWAKRTLSDHREDPRPTLYSADQIELGGSEDPHWNAAVREMRVTGYMHNYMRMYWGKKILEWLQDPAEAFALALRLNNIYFLDGRDPNSYANVAWVFGLHDRPWQERPIFGKVRYMAASGLERKFDMAAYHKKVARLASRTG